MGRKKIAIVGAGPGGLTAGMILASKGYEVRVFEKEAQVGGRNAALQLGEYTFDVGPTFLMMLETLESAFQNAGRNVHDYLDLRRIDPLYRLVYGSGREFFPTMDTISMKEQISRLFPGNVKGYDRYFKYEKEKYERLVPCLRIPYDKPYHYMRPRLMKALPYLDAHRSLIDHLGKYFKHDDLKIAFTFQAKYLGMSPWQCPATFSIISYLEHRGGIWHPIGGLNQISHAMAKVIEEEGGSIHLSTPVKEVLSRDGKVVGVKLEGGEDIYVDDVIVNADFGHAMTNLFGNGSLRKYTPAKLNRMGISCSTFMVYLGVDKLYQDVPHHNILFSKDYHNNIREISETMVLSEDPSVYVQNASVTDPSLAPEGKSAIYMLVPVANNRSSIDWEKEKEAFTDKVLGLAEERGGLTDLRKHIVEQKVITPLDWEQSWSVYRGAVFNLAHSIDQMLYLRPHNKFEELDNCFLTGGGTHPGSGLPTIYQSGIISAGMILKRDAWYL